MDEKSKAEYNVKLEDLFPLMKEKLEAGGNVIFKPRGVSMLPLIRQGIDSVTIEAVSERPSVGDVIFYRRPDGQFVLHRIIGENREGYILCGDNQCIKEFGVQRQWVIGVMTAVHRGDKTVQCDNAEYIRYVKKLKFRRLKLKVRRFLGGIKRRIFRKK